MCGVIRSGEKRERERHKPIIDPECWNHNVIFILIPFIYAFSLLFLLFIHSFHIVFNHSLLPIPLKLINSHTVIINKYQYIKIKCIVCMEKT